MSQHFKTKGDNVAFELKKKKKRQTTYFGIIQRIQPFVLQKQLKGSSSSIFGSSTLMSFSVETDGYAASFLVLIKNGLWKKGQIRSNE